MEPSLVAGTLDNEPMKDPVGVRRAEAMTTVLLISEGFVRAKITSGTWPPLAFVGSWRNQLALFGTGLVLHLTAESSEIWFNVPAGSPHRFG